jgi:hypothetical protein
VADCVQVDALAVNAESAVKLLFYNWRDANGAQLRRGKALVFHDESHVSLAAELASSFESLHYKTRIYDATVATSKIGRISIETFHFYLIILHRICTKINSSFCNPYFYC